MGISTKKKNKIKKKYSAFSRGVCILTGVLLILATVLLMISKWYDKNYEMSFKELLYTLLSPLEGTGYGMIKAIIDAVLPAVTVAFVIYVVFEIAVRNKLGMRLLGAFVSLALAFNSCLYACKAFGIDEYLQLMEDTTTIYEDYYVDPDTVEITADGKTKNLIYIYLESMETTYASKELGGWQETDNYIPRLTQLAMENVSFSDKGEGRLGGFKAPYGTGWTIAALLATLGGIPFAFPINDTNKMNERGNFAKGLTALGDILAEKGYAQKFLCGSEAEFGGRLQFFTQHGGYEIHDLLSAREEGYVPPDYHVWWGYEDMCLYNIAKAELTEMAAGDKPFNFTMLTVDTHAVDGYLCSKCTLEYENKTANVVSCADRQLYDFIEWCKQQDFYEDTAIVIVGDHPRHDQQLVDGIEIEYRTSYNCIINSAAQVEGSANSRVFTHFDMFPTVLAAMGFSIKGERLGLGVNMFSDEQTLPELMGYAAFNAEISKYSEYYILNFS